jgi:hypothetical protein
MEQEGLECRVGERRLVLPLAAVARVVELDVDTPPPLSASWVSGLGLLDGGIALAVALFPGPRRHERRRIVGIELRPDPAQPALRWVVEIERVEASVRGQAVNDEVEGKRWLKAGRDREGRELPWLDVAALRADLLGRSA